MPRARKKDEPVVTRGVVKEVPRTARRLHSVLPGSAVWGQVQRAEVDLGWLFESGFEGAIVRLRPPAGIAPAQVEAVKGAVLKAGALAVKVLPPESAGATLPAAAKPIHSVGVRQVVQEMVEQANTRNRDALRAFAEDVMSKEGI